MHKLFALLAFFYMLVLPVTAAAQGYTELGASVRTVSTTSWVEEWDPVSQEWVRISEAEAFPVSRAVPVTTVTTHIVNGEVITQSSSRPSVSSWEASSTRYSHPVAQRFSSAGIAQYGPFRVLDDTRVAMVGSTDGMSPRHFDAMLRDFPALEVLEMIDAPGTSNDIANLAVGRKIRAAGLRTHVPSGGSVRSGAVELFLAGTKQTMADNALFAVHSWLDNYGREADDFAADDPTHRLYLDYYSEMGMSEERAREFYDMTNSVPHASALWLRADDMRAWVKPEFHVRPERSAARHLAGRAEIGNLTWLQGPIETPALMLSEQNIRFARSVPSIDYGDLDSVSLARLDTTRLDSLIAFP